MFVFLISAVYSYWKAAYVWTIALVSITAVFAAVAAIVPRLLAPLNRAWFRLGMLLGKIVSPIVLGFIFFLMLTPVSLIARLFGRDVLRLKKRAAESYWVDRMPIGPVPDSFKNQF